MLDLNRTRPAAYLPDEMEDVQPPPKRHLPTPKSVNKGQGPSKEPAPKQAGEAHSSTGQEEKKEKKRRQATRARSREKSQSTRELSSDPEQEEESYSNKPERF